MKIQQEVRRFVVVVVVVDVVVVCQSQSLVLNYVEVHARKLPMKLHRIRYGSFRGFYF